MNKVDAAEKIINEYHMASITYPKMASKHEGYAILKEEIDELWDEIKRKKQDQKAIEKEATQVGAMILRFMVDCL